MRTSRFLTCALLGTLPAGLAAASTVSSPTFVVEDSVTFTDVDSNAFASGVTLSNVMAGSGATTVDTVRVTGDLTEVNTSTFGNEADIDISLFGGTPATFEVNAGGFGWVGTLDVDTSFTFAPFVVPAGSADYFFHEGFYDGGNGIDNDADATWDTVTIEFGNVSGGGVITNGSFSAGSLGADDTFGAGGTGMVNTEGNGSNVSGGLDFWSFTLTEGVQFVDIRTELGSGDAEIGLYTAAGDLIANDDDDGTAAHSQLSFGSGDTVLVEASDGEDGPTLAAGDYIIVVGTFNTLFTPLIGDISAGGGSGTYDLNIVVGAAPEPGSLALLALGGLAVLRRRR